MTYSRAKCHGCGDSFSFHDGCPDRIVICEECRQDPKKLDAARKAMNAHLATHVKVEFRRKMQTRRR